MIKFKRQYNESGEQISRIREYLADFTKKLNYEKKAADLTPEVVVKLNGSSLFGFLSNIVIFLFKNYYRLKNHPIAVISTI